MKLTIYWDFLARTSKPNKCEAIASTLSEASGLRFAISRREKYPEEKGLFKVWATSELEANSPGEALDAILSACSRIATTWNVFGPISSDTGEWEFGGAAAPQASKIQTIDYISFDVRATFARVRSQKAVTEPGGSR